MTAGGVLLAVLLAGCGGSAADVGSVDGPSRSGSASPSLATPLAPSGTSAAQLSPSATASSPSQAPRPTAATSEAPAVVPPTAGGTAASAGPVPWETAGLPSVAAPSASAASGPAQLTVLLDDGFGIRTTWTLTCDPVGGNHPSAATACAVLGANGAKALPKVDPNSACTMIYGGPQKAMIAGTWRAKAVNAEFSRENGCEIARWDALLGLLPRGGVAS